MRSQPSDRHYPAAYGQARALRRPLTPAETVLWRELRGKRLCGFKFRRQPPVGPYVADFFCAVAGLVVELDGDSHVDREAHDARRTAYLEDGGLKVMRFWNTEVADNLDGVLTAIHDACTARVAERESGGLPPSPLEGEGRGEARGVGGRSPHGENSEGTPRGHPGALAPRPPTPGPSPSRGEGSKTDDRPDETRPSTR